MANSPTAYLPSAQAPGSGAGRRTVPLKHLIDTTDFWNTRSTRLVPIIAYLRATPRDSNMGAYEAISRRSQSASERTRVARLAAPLQFADARAFTRSSFRNASACHTLDRIAGYFQISLLELANDEIATIPRSDRLQHRCKPDDCALCEWQRAAVARSLKTSSPYGLEQRSVPHLVDVHGELVRDASKCCTTCCRDPVRTVGTSRSGWFRSGVRLRQESAVIEGPRVLPLHGSANDSATPGLRITNWYGGQFPESIACCKRVRCALAKGFRFLSLSSSSSEPGQRRQ